MKSKKLYISLLLLVPAISFGNTLCPDAQSTREISDCLIEHTQQAEQRMIKYLSAAKNRYKSDATLVQKIELSQQAWKKYQEAHCNAVYQMWIEGTMRLISHPTCMLYTTKARTYDIWREFLTYGDSTPSLLPEPDLLLYTK